MNPAKIEAIRGLRVTQPGVSSANKSKALRNQANWWLPHPEQGRDYILFTWRSPPIQLPANPLRDPAQATRHIPYSPVSLLPASPVPRAFGFGRSGLRCVRQALCHGSRHRGRGRLSPLGGGALLMRTEGAIHTVGFLDRCLSGETPAPRFGGNRGKAARIWRWLPCSSDMR